MRLAKGMDARTSCQIRVKNARDTFLSVVIFTAINTVLELLQFNVYFLFSALLPYDAVGFGMVLTGKYDGTEATYGDGFFYGCLALALFVIMLWLGVYIFSKNAIRPCLIVGAVLAIIDTLWIVISLVLLGNLPSIFDLAFHGWMLYSVFAGLKALHMLEHMPKEAVVYDVEPNDTYGNNDFISNQGSGQWGEQNGNNGSGSWGNQNGTDNGSSAWGNQDGGYDGNNQWADGNSTDGNNGNGANGENNGSSSWGNQSGEWKDKQ